MPADLAALIHCSGSRLEGLKTAGSAVPSPHSRSMNVFGPKWISAPISRSCQATCCGLGFTSVKFCPNEPVAQIQRKIIAGSVKVLGNVWRIFSSIQASFDWTTLLPPAVVEFVPGLPRLPPCHRFLWSLAHEFILGNVGKPIHKFHNLLFKQSRVETRTNCAHAAREIPAIATRPRSRCSD